MRDCRFKEASLAETDHHINWATGNTQMGDQALFFTTLQHLDGTARLHRLCKGNMLGVVKIDELQLLQAQQAQAALNAAPHLRASEDASLQIAVGLGCQHESRRDPAKLAEHYSNAALAFTIAVGSSGIQEIKGTSPAVAVTSKESTNCGQGALFPDAIRESLRHIAKRGGANADRGYLQACRAKWARGQRL